MALPAIFFVQNKNRPNWIHFEFRYQLVNVISNTSQCKTCISWNRCNVPDQANFIIGVLRCMELSFVLFFFSAKLASKHRRTTYARIHAAYNNKHSTMYLWLQFKNSRRTVEGHEQVVQYRGGFFFFEFEFLTSRAAHSSFFRAWLCWTLMRKIDGQRLCSLSEYFCSHARLFPVKECVCVCPEIDTSRFIFVSAMRGRILFYFIFLHSHSHVSENSYLQIFMFLLWTVDKQWCHDK